MQKIFKIYLLVSAGGFGVLFWGNLLDTKNYHKATFAMICMVFSLVIYSLIESK